MQQLVGYARVSTMEQNLWLQKDALSRAGCVRIFEDKISGVKEERPGLHQALDFMREGDTLVVWRLDRLGRSLRHLIDTVTLLQKKGIGFKSLQENLDTTSSTGKLVFHIFGALAEFERDVIRSRTKAGLSAARARGRLGGRPKKLNANQLKIAKSMYADKSLGIGEICKTLKISRSTLYRSLKSEK
jgi:DNA invertase Pin-like site-specific DNA recombinase